MPCMSDSGAIIRVLVVCTGNSARSQLGEALIASAGGPAFEVHSAGTDPKGVNPHAVRVLAARGIDWSGATSKHLSAFLGQPFDYVITVCDRANDACPVFPGGGERLHWSLEDPAAVEGTDEAKLAAFEATARELDDRIGPFVEQARSKAR
jgi:arsenate reductase (thioredoxin)